MIDNTLNLKLNNLIIENNLFYFYKFTQYPPINIFVGVLQPVLLNLKFNIKN